MHSFSESVRKVETHCEINRTTIYRVHDMHTYYARTYYIYNAHNNIEKQYVIFSRLKYVCA